MKITVFAGTFNPIHTAHLILAESVRTALKFEKIIFIPSFCPPHREESLAPAEDRLNMVKLAIADNPCFEVSDIEFSMSGKSYSVNTIRKLYEKYLDISGKINFIIGTDAFLHIKTWHKAEELISLVRFIVLSRSGNGLGNDEKLKNIDFTVVNTPIVDISSSQVRERIQTRKSIKYLVSEPVREYIQKNGLYL